MAVSHGPLRPGKGMVSGMLALFLANFCLFGVVMLLFPSYLTTPKVREYVSFDMMRIILISAMFLCGTIAIYNISFNRIRRLSSWALLWLTVALLLSLVGAHIQGYAWLATHGDLNIKVPYLGVDWLILDLLATTLIFTSIEKLHPLKQKMSIFRKYWQTDFAYFVTGHLFVGLTLFLVYAALYGMTNSATIIAPVVQGTVQDWIQQLPFVGALLLLMLITDFARYWLHRLYHETSIGWRFHSIHHSAEDMDWIWVVELMVLKLCYPLSLFLRRLFY